MLRVRANPTFSKMMRPICFGCAAIRLAGYARWAKNSEVEQQSEEIRTLAERRIRQLLADAETATKAAMLAPDRGDLRARAAWRERRS
jgi:hypothetical protein